MASYKCLMVIYGLTRLLFKIYGFEISVTLTLTFPGHLRLKKDGVIGLPIYVFFFLLMFNNNIWPNWASCEI